MGGILTLLTVVALQYSHAPRSQSVSSKTEAISADSAQAVSRGDAKSESANVISKPGTLFSYHQAPTNAEAIERNLPAPSREIHYVKIDPQMTGVGSPLTQIGGRVEVTLPNGVIVPAIVESTEKVAQGSFVSTARLEGTDGEATFAVSNGEMSATLDSLALGAWQIRALGDGTSQVFKVDSQLVPPCAEVPAKHLSVLGSPATGSLGASAADATVEADTADGSAIFAPAANQNPTINQTVRVLVPYSSKILAYTTTDAVHSAVYLAIANVNNDLSRSGAPVKIVLSLVYSVPYAQDGTDSANTAIDNALTRVTSATDGILDSVHVTRVQTNSDLVCLLINQYDSTNSGVAYVLKGAGDVFNPTYGFAAITYGYLNSSRTFSHELGHNFGCNHDRGNAYSTSGAPPTGTYAYSYGYRFYGNDGAQYRTIMAYPPGQVVAYFSNPNLTLPSPVSKAVGIPLSNTSAQAYNALTITQNAAEVANYHNSSLIKRIASRIH